MSFLKWFNPRKGRNDDINVTKIPQKSIADGTMAAAGLSGAAEDLAHILKQRQASPQILVVGSENFSKNLVEYALKMGQRLDCQIIAVNTTSLPSSLNKEQYQKAREQFFTAATKAGVRLTELAESIGTSVKHCMEIGTEEEIIHELAAENPGIRYVLTEPEDNNIADQDTTQIPVFDLACSRI